MLIALGLPVYDGRPYAQFVDALLAEQLRGFSEGVHFLPIWALGIPDISIARDWIAEKFLRMKGCDTLVMLDADIAWRSGDVTRLALRPEEVVGGTYRRKQDDVVFHLQGTPECAGDVYRVLGIPGGFMKISRRAFEAMNVPSYIGDDGVERKRFFASGMHDGRIYTDDYALCLMWRQAGGEVFLDPSFQLRHVDGPRRSYEGNPAEWIESLA